MIYSTINQRYTLWSIETKRHQKQYISNVEILSPKRVRKDIYPVSDAISHYPSFEIFPH